MKRLNRFWFWLKCDVMVVNHSSNIDTYFGAMQKIFHHVVHNLF